MKCTRFSKVTAALVVAIAAPLATAQDATPTKEQVARVHGGSQFSPYAGRSFPTRVLFGDTHLHTSVSVDAGTMNSLGQEQAYRWFWQINS